jgi:hypothetical protein
VIISIIVGDKERGLAAQTRELCCEVGLCKQFGNETDPGFRNTSLAGMWGANGETELEAEHPFLGQL